MKCSRRAARVELAVAADGLVRRQGLDLDTAPPELSKRLRVGTQLPVRAGADDQPLRQLIDDVLEVGKNESVPLRPPPIGEHAIGQNDQVTRLRLTIDDDVPEAVALDARRRLTSDRFVLSPAPVGRLQTLAATLHRALA